MDLFKGIVKLSEQQYSDLKTYGYINVGDTKIEFDENTLYVTDYAEPKIDSFSQIKIIDSLPTTGDSNICYWIEQENNAGIYDQYIWINDRFSFASTTQISLKDYVLKSEMPTSLPSSDVYDWAKTAQKPNYTLEEIDTKNYDLNLGDNTTVDKRNVSITRNISNIAHQALITIYDDGSVRISHRNKNNDANTDDSYIEFGPSKLKYGASDILTSNNSYKKEEIDAMIQELKSLINGQ